MAKPSRATNINDFPVITTKHFNIKDMIVHLKFVIVCNGVGHCANSLRYTVKHLLSDQLRDHQKAIAEEKWLLNATKVHHTKQSDGIYHTLTTHYFQQNAMLLVLI